MSRKKPTIIKRSQHTVSRRDIDPDALGVMRHLNRNGHKAYLVGGGVRDILLGRKPKDFDISTDAEPPRIRKLFRNCFLVGRRFRLAHIRFGRHKVIETSTFRRMPTASDNDSTDGELVQWDDNSFGTPAEDARRRDFTINALFYDLRDFTLIDHVGGLSDLRKGVIRSIGDPNVRFREDPVRMLRAIRFAARLGFRIESATRRAILRHHADIALASPSRLLEEIYKLFTYRSGEAAFFLMWELKLMSSLLPSLHAYIEDNGKKKAQLWRYLAALDSGQHAPDNPGSALMLSVLFYALVAHHVEAARATDRDAADRDLIDAALTPIALRFKVPRAVRYRMVRLIENQYRMDKAALPQTDRRGRRQSAIKRMVHHESFPESLALLEIRTASGGCPTETLSYWKHVLEKEGKPVSAVKLMQTAEPTEKNRPPSRRRRRKPSHAVKRS
jgi:poly(A) polymerase